MSAKENWTQRVLKMGAESKQALKTRMDAFANAMTGVGTSRDKSTYMRPYVECLLSPLELENLWHTSDLANRIVSAVPDECFRERCQVINKTSDSNQAEDIHDQASQLEADLDNLSVHQKMREAVTWGRLYGVGVLMIGADDGLPPEEPLDWTRVKSIRFITVLDKRDVVPWRWYSDPTAPHFGDIAVYQIQPVGVFLGAPYDITATNQIITVHESRLIRFGGELTSKRERLRNQGADYSILQRCYRALQLTDNNWQSAAALMSDASQGVFKIKGLIDMISQEPEVMQNRMILVDQMRSVVRALVIDTEEDFERKPTPFAGIPDMLKETWTRLAAAARMPLTVLMGMAPTGLNNSDESGMRWWYDTIRAYQESAIRPGYERLLCMLAQARGYPNPQDWSVNFVPLWQMNAKEQAEAELNIAKRDQIYLQEGVWMPEEVALSRTGGGSWSKETTIDVDARKKLMSLRVQAQMKMAKNPEAMATPGVYMAGAPAKSQATPSNPDLPPHDTET